MIFALVCYIMALTAVVFVFGASWRPAKPIKPRNNLLYVATANLEHDLELLPHIDTNVLAACKTCLRPGAVDVMTTNEQRQVRNTLGRGIPGDRPGEYHP